MSTGAIAAARMKDRHSALAMLEEAAEASRKAPKLVLSAGHVVTYQIGVSIILGDAGTVIEHARSIAPDDIPTLEGRASCYTGVAEAYTLWGIDEDGAVVVPDSLAKPRRCSNRGSHRRAGRERRRRARDTSGPDVTHNVGESAWRPDVMSWRSWRRPGQCDR